MAEWLDINVAYWHWIVMGLLLAAIEIFVPSFFMLWLGISALIVGIIGYFVGMPFAVQLAIWVALSIVTLVAWFKFISPLMETRSLSGMAKEAAVGQEGTVIEYNRETGRGRVRFTVPLLGASEWSFICDGELTVGEKAYVRDVTGNSLLVRKK